MVTRKVNLLAGLALILSCGSAFAQVYTKQVLMGYKCMMLAQQWGGQGPVPPPVPVYSGPHPNAEQVGIAGGTVIVPSTGEPNDGRMEMLFPNGRKVWIDVANIVPWHSKADPTSMCRPVLLSNGRYGTDGGR